MLGPGAFQKPMLFVANWAMIREHSMLIMEMCPMLTWTKFKLSNISEEELTARVSLVTHFKLNL